MVQPFLPNEADAFNANQAEPDSVDIEILLLGYQRTGVVSGCAVTESSPAAQTVDVALGEVVETGEQISVSAQADVAVSAADGSNPRFDLITINGSGTVVVTAGTAAAQPVLPAIPASSVPLAALYIPTSDNTHADEQIVDKRVFVADRYVFNVKDFGALADDSTDDTAAVQAAIDASEVADVAGRFTSVFFPAGKYRVAELEWNVDASLVGDNIGEAILRYNGAGGAGTYVLALNKVGGAIPWSHIVNLTFDGDNSALNCIVNNNTADYDIGFGFDRVGIQDCTGDGIDLTSGEVVNLHLERIRFTDVDGYGLHLAGTSATEERPITLKEWTWSHTGNGQGLLRIDDGKGYSVAIADGRFEATAALTADPNGDKSIIFSDNTIAGARTTMLLSNFHGFVQVADNAVWVNDPNGRTDVTAINSSIGSDVAVQKSAGTNFGTGNYSLYVRGVFDQRLDPISKNIEFGDIEIIYGSDDPEGSVTAPLGSIYFRTNSATRKLYTKEVGAGNTGWRPIDLLATEVAGAVTLDWEESIVNMESTAATRLVTLPDNAAFTGKSYLIRRDGSNIVTIDRAGSDTFDDADVQKTLDSDSAAIGIFSIGDGEWKIVGTEGTVGGS